MLRCRRALRQLPPCAAAALYRMCCAPRLFDLIPASPTLLPLPPWPVQYSPSCVCPGGLPLPLPCCNCSVGAAAERGEEYAAGPALTGPPPAHTTATYCWHAGEPAGLTRLGRMPPQLSCSIAAAQGVHPVEHGCLAPRLPLQAGHGTPRGVECCSRGPARCHTGTYICSQHG